MLRSLGLRQRIIGIFAGGALITTLIVGLSLHELSQLEKHSKTERVAEHRRDRIHETLLTALRNAAVFSSLGLDLTAEEQKQTIVEGDALLARFEDLRLTVDPLLRELLPAANYKSLTESAADISRAWREIKEETAQGDRDELLFHLVAIIKNTDRLREVLLTADDTATIAAMQASRANDRRTAQAQSTLLIALLVGLGALISIGWLIVHFGVRRPLNVALAAVSRIAGGDIDSPVPAVWSSDEIGSIMSALALLRDHALARKRLEEAQALDVSERDMRRERLESTIA